MTHAIQERDAKIEQIQSQLNDFKQECASLTKAMKEEKMRYTVSIAFFFNFFFFFCICGEQ